MGIGTILIRADATSAMGTGHVMRCLALAQAWQDAGGKAAFAMVQSTEALQIRLARESCHITPIRADLAGADDMQQTVAIANDLGCEWIVLDGYQFGSAFQAGLKSSGAKVLVPDDYGHAGQYPADVVLNQSVTASPTLYSSCSPGTRLLLGPRYSLLRREFSRWRDWRRTIPSKCRRVLVTMGGSDEHNVTATVLQALSLMGSDGLETTVLAGGSNRHLIDLHQYVARSGSNVEVRTDVCDVGESMAQSDVAISAAGSTCWELCLLSLPSLLIDIADNQTPVAKEMDRRRCAVHIGDQAVRPQAIVEALKSLVADCDLRRALAENSKSLVDGRGAARVVAVLTGSPVLQLRALREGDRRLLWEWANDPEVRSASFSSDPIPWDTHTSWFNAKLPEPPNTSLSHRVFIAEDEEGVPVGQIRFEKHADAHWDVGLSLSKDFRGRGLASRLIAIGIRELIADAGHASMHAYVKPQNVASVKSFERAGFERIGVEQVNGREALHLVYS